MSTFNYLIDLTDGDLYEIVAANFASGDVIVQNTGSTDVLLGNSNVASDNYGLKLTPGMGLSVSLGSSDELYALTVGGDSQISILLVRGK